MYKKDEFEGFIALARLLSGEKDVLENMEFEGQERAVRNIQLAKRMYPSQEDWESLGFVFVENPNEEVLYDATLPEGWKIVATTHPMWNDIIDVEGRKRGSMFYKASFYDRSAHMRLETRYKVNTEYSGEDDSIVEVYFGSPEEKLFIAGTVIRKKDETDDEYGARMQETDRLTQIAASFAYENYPDFENVHAYWDDSKKIDQGTQITKK